MTDLEFVLAGFREHFADYLGRRILLHGSREYAREIIEHFRDAFGFIGVISYELEGTDSFCGLPVFQDSDIERLGADLLIITERVRHDEEVFQNVVSSCQNAGTAVFNMYGVNEQTSHREVYACRKQDLDGWIRLCGEYDVIAFEVMDTLVYPLYLSPVPKVRKVLAELIRYLAEQGKPVRFSLRKSYPEDLQMQYLKDAGLLNEADCTIRRSNEDLSFSRLKESFPESRILYIGRGLINECLLPRCYGIDTYRFVGMDTDHGMAANNTESHICNDRFKADAENCIRDHDVISFDIFDTLLIRMTLCPEDVFHITEQRGLAEGIPCEGFADLRQGAGEAIGLCSIEEIYAHIGSVSRLDAADLQRLQKIEFETEMQVIRPREPVIELLQMAQSEGKTVVLTSDMYYREAELEKLLTENGINGYSRIFVSCSQGKTKSDGLFEIVKKTFDEERRLLHIGDNAYLDGESCRRYGIDSFLLPSPAGLAKERGWANAMKHTSGLSERILVGMAVSNLFADPFQAPDVHDLSVYDRLKRYAFGAFIPLVIGYMTWIIDRTAAEKPDAVLFMARDGFIPSRIYETVRGKYGLPDGIYYYASRRATYLFRADDAHYLWKIVDYLLESGMSVSEIITDYFEIPAAEKGTEDDYETNHLITRSIPEIAERAVRSRNGFIEYSRRCGLSDGGKYLLVDFVSGGTILRNLSECMPFSYHGLCFGTYLQEVMNDPAMECYCPVIDDPLILGYRYLEPEVFLTSPEPSVRSISGDGRIIPAKELRSDAELADFQTVLAFVMNAAEIYFDLFEERPEVISPALVSEMYFIDEDHMVQQFAYDDLNECRIPLVSRADSKEEQE